MFGIMQAKAVVNFFFNDGRFVENGHYQRDLRKFIRLHFRFAAGKEPENSRIAEVSIEHNAYACKEYHFQQHRRHGKKP